MESFLKPEDHLALVAVYKRSPWDKDGCQPKRIILTEPSSENPESSAWDIIASILGSKTRNDFRIEHQSLGIDGSDFVATDDVETEQHHVEVRSNFDNEIVELSIFFSAFISGDEEYWCVSLDNPKDILLLQTLLAEKKSSIEIRTDESELEHQIQQMKDENDVLQVRLDAVLNLMEGFEDTLVLEEWDILPTIPTGWGLLRLLRGWLSRGQFDYTQVEFVLWMLNGRSQKVWQYIVQADTEIATTMEESLLAVLESEFSGHRGSPAHGRGSPKYLRWKAQRRELGKELEWLTTPAIAGRL